VSVIDDVKVTPAVSQGNSTPAVVSPTLAQLNNQPRSYPAASPQSIGFTAPDGTIITSVTSSNQLLLPDRNVGAQVYDPSGNNNLSGVVSLTPLGDQTGTANVTVTYGPGTQTATIPVTVVDRHLANPGFEPGLPGWSGGTIVGGGLQTQGAGAVEINGSGSVTQLVTGLPHNTPYVLKAATKGGVNVTVTTVPDEKMKDNADKPHPSYIETYTAEWTGASWTQNQVGVATTQCPGCRLAGSIERYQRNPGPTSFYTMVPGGQFDITFTDAAPGDGQPVYVDDVRLLQAPRVDRIPELSITSTDTSYGYWTGLAGFNAGRVPMNARFNATQLAMSSSDATVLPDSNLSITAGDARGGYDWQVHAKTGAGLKTGRSNVTVTLADPSGNTTAKTLGVTVNAGNNFRNGDFERGTEGWTDGWFNLGWEIVSRQTWRYLNPVDKDKVLRISSGVTGYKVTGLTAGEAYKIRANALGSGSTVEVYANTVLECNDAASDNTFCLYWWGQSRGSVPVDRTTWGPVKDAANADLQFTPIANNPNTAWNDTDVWIVVRDADRGDGPDPDDPPQIDDPPYKVPRSIRYCAVYTAGETCIDDIAIFKAADVP
ncbi:MAG: hypothetical protein ACRD0U_18405, partial [Acidimicrobiales bacterium]